MSAPPRVASAIVAFAPRRDLILPLAERLARESAQLIVFVNALIEDDLAAELEKLGAQLMRSEVNLGIAEALNMAALSAIMSGHERLALFDQDSSAPEGMIAALSARMDAVIAAGERPAVIGPRIVAPAGEAFKAPRAFAQPGKRVAAGAAPVRYVITSGSLIDLGAFRHVGPFRSDFFIDAVDTEWCFRAWARGCSVWMDEGVRLEHRIGAGVMRGLAGRAYPQQAAFRQYAYLRNQAYCLKLRHIPLGWKARVALHGLALIAAIWRSAGWLAAKNALRGARDGLAGRLGPPPGAAHAARLED